MNFPGLAETDVAHADRSPGEEGRETGKRKEPAERKRRSRVSKNEKTKKLSRKTHLKTVSPAETTLT